MKTLKALLLLAVVLSVDHSVTADPIPDPNSQDLLKRSVLDFANIILCNMPNSNPYAYTDYGCYCGYGGKGNPVDDLDRCCQVHDECYGKVQKNPKCDSYFGKYAVPYIMSYVYTCDKEKKKAICSKTNDKCQMILCKCDRKAAKCFAKSTYNGDYWDLDQERCKQG